MEEIFELMEMAYNTKSKAQRIRIYKEIIRLDDSYLDAKIELALLEGKNAFDILFRIESLLVMEKQSLELEGYFSEEYIGSFYSIFETRPYMRLMYTKLQLLIEVEYYHEALQYGSIILNLNEGDNLGIRFIVFGLMVKLGRSKTELKKFSSQYDSDNLEFKLGMFIWEYRHGTKESALKQYHSITKKFPNFSPQVLKLLQISFEVPTSFQFDSEEHLLNALSNYKSSISIEFCEWCIDNDPKFEILKKTKA